MKLNPPEQNTQLKASDKSEEVLRFMNERRSALARGLGAPGPSAGELDLILRLAARTPDHRKLFPWRFIVFEDSAREKFGEQLAEIFAYDNPDIPTDRVEFERKRFLRAPLVIGVVSSPKNCPRGTPKWEQELSAGAVCMNLLLAARASGYGAIWLTEWYAFDERIDKILGLEEAEKMAGFVYIGTPTEQPCERPRADMSKIISRF